jgi:tRNA modification GTPase
VTALRCPGNYLKCTLAGGLKNTETTENRTVFRMTGSSSTPFDTIAAVSTPPGEGGIGIVRLSGEDSIRIVQSLFDPHRGNSSSLYRSHAVHLGHIRRDGKSVDEVLVNVMRAPRTYTREDVVEINCHGGAVAVNEVLRLVLAAGARPAEPGEFTKRAYINGRIDLAQAEAVLDIVRAKTGRALSSAVNQLRGSISRQIEATIEKLKGMLISLEAAIDFPEEEDVEPVDFNALAAGMKELQTGLKEMIGSYETGKMLKNGVLTVIAGKPNVGKSSIMNAFLKYDRAIVTEIPGTTRDVIEEQLNIEGIPFILADTAGITETDDIIELEGVRRSRSHLERAQLIILVMDGSAPIDAEDREIAEKAASLPHITVINKSDLPTRLNISDLQEFEGLDTDYVSMSAMTGEGLGELEKRMVQKLVAGTAEGDNSILVTNARHFSILQRAGSELTHAINGVAAGGDPELIAFDIKSVMDILGEITGHTATDEILNGIFENFCIGK